MKAMSQSKAMENIAEHLPAVDSEVAEKVGQEILENRLDPGTWATALSASGGKRQEALASYARIRIHHLSSHQRLRYAKVESFESRRMRKCFGVRTVQDLLMRSNHGETLNFLKPRLSIVSMMILFVGSAGSVGAIGRLLGDILPEMLAGVLPLLSVFCGLLAVAAAVSLRQTLPKRWIMLGWNTGLLCTCSVACFASLLCGVKLIARAAPLDSANRTAIHVASPVMTTTVVQDQAPAVVSR